MHYGFYDLLLLFLFIYVIHLGLLKGSPGSFLENPAGEELLFMSRKVLSKISHFSVCKMDVPAGGHRVEVVKVSDGVDRVLLRNSQGATAMVRFFASFFFFLFGATSGFCWLSIHLIHLALALASESLSCIMVSYDFVFSFQCYIFRLAYMEPRFFHGKPIREKNCYSQVARYSVISAISLLLSVLLNVLPMAMAFLNCSEITRQWQTC